jgi:hypothetical protein
MVDQSGWSDFNLLGDYWSYCAAGRRRMLSGVQVVWPDLVILHFQHYDLSSTYELNKLAKILKSGLWPE